MNDEHKPVEATWHSIILINGTDVV